MAKTPLDERRFTDEEVRKILKKAVERASSRSLVKRDGLSLAELKSIAEEVGIDSDRLEDAARAVTLGEGNHPNRFFGGPTVMDYERRVDGEFDPKDTPELLSLIRRIMGTQGEVDEIHGSLEWRAKGDSGERYVTLSPRDGTTTIRSSANLTNAAVLTFLLPGIFGLIGTGVAFGTALSDGSAVGLVIAFTLLPTLYTVLRTAFRKISGREFKKLRKVVDELARLTEGSGACVIRVRVCVRVRIGICIRICVCIGVRICIGVGVCIPVCVRVRIPAAVHARVLCGRARLPAGRDPRED